MTPGYDDCQARVEIDSLKRWQGDQNGHLGRIDGALGELVVAEAKRTGAEGMLKWIIGIVGVSGLISIAGLIVGVVT